MVGNGSVWQATFGTEWLGWTWIRSARQVRHGSDRKVRRDLRWTGMARLVRVRCSNAGGARWGSASFGRIGLLGQGLVPQARLGRLASEWMDRQGMQWNGTVEWRSFGVAIPFYGII